MANEGTKEIPFYTVDAFTDKPFSGNPAAVCLLPKDLTLTDQTLQLIAAEINLSETSFIQPIQPDEDFISGSEFTIRWFTPTSEVPLCGHATLASSAVLFFCKHNKRPSVTFSSKSGPLIVRVNNDKITMDFPLNRVESFDMTSVSSLIQEVCDPKLIKEIQYSPTTKKLLLRLHDDVTRKTLEDFIPDTRTLKACEKMGQIKGVIVTMKGRKENDPETKDYDFLSRYFAPWVGISEDPVTARQCSKRGGDLEIQIVGERVELTGQARIVLTGTLHL